MKKTLLITSSFFACLFINAQPILKPYNGPGLNSNTKSLPIIQNNIGKQMAAADLAYTQFDTLSHYVMIPVSQAQPLVLGGILKNVGKDTVTNVAMNVNIKNYSNTSVYSATGNTTNILMPDSSTYSSVPSFTPTIADLYTIKFGSSMDQTDADTTNNIYYGSVLISDTTFARDNGQVSGSLGIGAGNGGYIGQHYEVFNTAQATSITFFVTKGYTGKKAAAVIWDFANGQPNNIIAATDTMLYPDDSARVYTIPLSENKVLTPGKYAVTMIEFDSTISLGTTANFFENNATWIKWPTSPGGSWVNNEAFNLKVVYVVRLNLDAYTTINKQEQYINCSIFPNPTYDLLNVTFTGLVNKSNTSFQLYDNKGSLVLSESSSLMNNQNYQLNISNLSSGVYILKIITADGVSVHKITKKH